MEPSDTERLATNGRDWPCAVDAFGVRTGVPFATGGAFASCAPSTSALPANSQNLLLVVAAEETGDIRTVLGSASRLGWSGEGLSLAQQERLVRTSGTHVWFHHPVLRSATYRSASIERRRTVHQAIAEELATGPESDRAVWHCAVATTTPNEELARALEDSADTARRRGGEAAAASVLQRAAQLSETSASQQERTVTAAVVALDSGQPDLARTLTEGVLAASAPEATLTHLLGNIEFYSGDPAVAHAHLMRCGELLSATDPEEAAWLFAGASSAAFHARDLGATTDAARRITELECSAATRTAGRSMAEGSKLTGSQLWTLVTDLSRSQPMAGGRPWMWATAVAWLGPDHHQARLLAEEAVRRLHTIGATAQLTELLSYQADIEYRLGRWNDATAHAEEGLRFTHETGQRPWRANLLALLAQLAAARGAAAECRHNSERALAIAVALRERAAASLASAALGLLSLGEGEPDEAWTHLARLVTPGSPSAHPYTALASIIDIVEAAVRTQRQEFVLDLLRGYESWVTANPSPAGSATLHHCHALLAGTTDDSAEWHFQRALATQGVAENPFPRGRTALLYGEWLRRNQRPSTHVNLSGTPPRRSTPSEPTPGPNGPAPSSARRAVTPTASARTSRHSSAPKNWKWPGSRPRA